MRRAELAVMVLLLAPSALSFVPSAVAGRPGFDVSAAAVVLRDTGLTGLCALLVWRAGQPLSALGWRWRGAVRCARS